MADRVVIVGLRRGGSLVPSSELRQMMGRAGREHDEEGIVELVVGKDDEGVISEILLEGATVVASSLSNPDILAMSLMPEIYRGNVKTTEAAMVWASRSFCSDPPLQKAMELLSEVEAIKEREGKLEATPIGSCAARFYFHPADVYAWWCNFGSLFEMGLENDELAPAWALGNVPSERIIGDLGERRELASECGSRMPFGLQIMKGSVINVLSWWCLMGGPSPGPIRLAALERRKGFGRYRSALDALNVAAGWGMEDFFDDLEMRIKKGLVPDLVPLCRFSGMNKERASYLYELGVRAPCDFGLMMGRLDEEIDDDFKQTIENIARKHGQDGC